MGRRLLLAWSMLAVAELLAGCARTLPPPRYAVMPPPQADRFRFVICGDTRSRILPWRTDGSEARQKLMERVVALGPEFVVNVGDLVAIGDNKGSWAAFDEVTTPIRDAGIKYVPALGNHEYLGNNSTALASYFARFPELGQRKWYAYAAGPLLLVLLDSNFSDLRAAEREAQKKWLMATLARAEKSPRIKFVLLGAHHPPYTNGGHFPRLRVLTELVEPAKRFSKVRGLISGHIHTYERFEVDGFTYVVSGGCGAPLAKVETDPASWRTEPVYLGPALRPHHLVLCEVEPERLSCSVEGLVEDEQWRVIDRFELTPKD